MRTQEAPQSKALYAYTFPNGGYNQEYGTTEEEARTELVRRCGEKFVSTAITVRRCNEEEEKAYYKSIALWD